MSAQYPRQVLFMPLHCSRLGIDRQASVILSLAWNCNEAGDWSANKRDAHVLEATLIEVIWLGIMLNCMNRWAKRSRDSFDQSVIRIQFQEKRKYNKRIKDKGNWLLPRKRTQLYTHLFACFYWSQLDAMVLLLDSIDPRIEKRERFRDESNWKTPPTRRKKPLKLLLI